MFDEVPEKLLLLTIVMDKMTKHSPKMVIDLFMIVQLKLSLPHLLLSMLIFATEQISSKFYSPRNRSCKFNWSELFELLTEDGNKYRTESTGELFELAHRRWKTISFRTIISQPKICNSRIQIHSEVQT